MTKVSVLDGKIIYKKMMKSHEIPLNELIWAYLQREDVNTNVCCGKINMEIGRVITLDKRGKKQSFQFEGMEEAEKLLSKIQQGNPRIAIGYTRENREKFE